VFEFFFGHGGYYMSFVIDATIQGC
jgi:hypothetical protein